MKTRRYKLSLAATILVAFGGLAAVLVTGTSPRLGLDLEGGTSVILTAVGEGEEVQDDVLQKTVSIIRQRIDALGVAEPEVSAAGSNQILVQLPGVEDEQTALKVIGTTAQLTFREVLEIAPRDPPEKGKALAVTKKADSTVNDQEVVYPDQNSPDTLYRLAPAALTGDAVTQAQASVDPTTGASWAVDLTMNDEGTEKWEKLTAEQACQRDRRRLDEVAIVLDGEVVSAPGMDPSVACDVGITGVSQIDTGGEREAKNLALVLRYGSLPLTLRQDEVSKVSATLGRDSLQAGITAGVIGLALVMLYVLVYYRGLGMILWAGLLVFTASLYVLLALLGEGAGLSLSLAGIAGIIVSVGVTSDSYIVAFERIKDEVHAGKSMRASVERGMSRALKTIVVADVVTGTAAVILFFLAVGPVRGFALTLGLATLIDLMVAFLFTRSAAHLLARTRVFSGSRFVGVQEART